MALRRYSCPHCKYTVKVHDRANGAWHTCENKRTKSGRPTVVALRPKND